MQYLLSVYPDAVDFETLSARAQKLVASNGDPRFANDVYELRGELFNVKVKRSTGQLENTAKLQQLRRDIARVETVLREKRGAKK